MANSKSREMILDPKVTSQQVVDAVSIFQKTGADQHKVENVTFANGKMADEDMFRRVFEQNPKVTRIRTSLDETNAAEFNTSLVNRLKSSPDFVANTKPIDPTVKARLEKKGESALVQLNECCSEYLNLLQTKHPEEY